MNNRLVKPGLCLLLVAGASVALLRLYAPSEPEPPSPDQRLQEALRSWRAHKFTAFRSKEEALELIRRFPVDLQCAITEAQHEALLDTLSDLLEIYRAGSHERFLSHMRKRRGFCTAQLRKGPFFTQPLGTIAMTRLVTVTMEPYDPHDHEGAEYVRRVFKGWRWPPKSDSERFHAYWHLRYHSSGVWKSVSADGGQIMVFEDASPKLTRLIVDRRHQPFWENGVFFGGVPQRLVAFPESPGKSKFAMLYFVAEHRAPDPPWPHTIWVRWEPSVRNWVLSWAAMSYIGERHHSSNVAF